MSDPLEASGPDESGLLPEGEFASHFFDEMGHSDKPAPSASAFEEDVPRSAPVTMAELPPPPPDVPPGHPVFPVVVGFGFLAIIVIGAVLSALPVQQPPPAAAAPAPAAATEAPAKDSALSALAESLKTEVGNLSKQVKDLEERLAAMPKPAPAPDLEPLNAKVAELSKSAESAAGLPKKIDSLDKRVEGLDESLQSLQAGMTPLKEELVALRADLKKGAATTTSAKPVAPSEPVNVNVEGQSFAQAVDLFKAGKYKEAGDVLKTTEANDPKDARVWYYAALCRGASTKDWQNDTLKLVQKGVAREKAGTPPTADIDAEFAKLDASMKTWLDFYRKSAK